MSGENIDQLRAKIDVIDENLLYALGSRMKISRQIGEYKRDNNIAILQTSRWDSILAKMVAKGEEYGLPQHFIEDVFNAIHEAVVDLPVEPEGIEHDEGHGNQRDQRQIGHKEHDPIYGSELVLAVLDDLHSFREIQQAVKEGKDRAEYIQKSIEYPSDILNEIPKKVIHSKLLT